jgi:hypothetical protein
MVIKIEYVTLSSVELICAKYTNMIIGITIQFMLFDHTDHLEKMSL